MGQPVVHWELWSQDPVDKTTVPGVGEFSLFEDPDGRVLGMWNQQKP